MGTRRRALAENGAEKSIPRAHEAQFGQISHRADPKRSRNDLPIIVHNRARRSDVTLKKRSDPESSPDGNAPLREESLMVFRLLSHIARIDVTCGELRFPTG